MILYIFLDAIDNFDCLISTCFCLFFFREDVSPRFPV